MKNMSRLVLAVSILFVVGCGDLDQPVNEQVSGGNIVVDLDGQSIKGSLIAAGTPGVDETTTVYGYKAYKIPYTTTDEEGNDIQVSGLMVVPTGVPEAMTQAGFSMVSDSHGTIFANAEAPTVIAGSTSAPAGSSVILTSLFAFVTFCGCFLCGWCSWFFAGSFPFRSRLSCRRSGRGARRRLRL